MPKFRKKPDLFEAWQFKGDPPWGAEDSPRWLDMLGLSYSACGGQRLLHLPTDMGGAQVRVNEWIVLSPGGEAVIFPPLSFEWTFALAEGE